MVDFEEVWFELMIRLYCYLLIENDIHAKNFEAHVIDIIIRLTGLIVML
jgi:hypothetical protein